MLNSLKSAGRMVASTFVVLTALAIFLTAGKYIESKFLPVVPKFTVGATSWDGETLTIWGEMDKVRECKFDGMLAYYRNAHGNPVRVPVRFPDEKETRPAIEQEFGPIWIDMPSEYVIGTPITLWGNHKCHFLWFTTAKLATFSPSIRGLTLTPTPPPALD